MARIVDAWDWSVPLRLLGGLHYLVLGGEASWDDVERALAEHEDLLLRFLATPLQTNEVQRSWVLLPCFLEAARRTGADVLDLVELGPSAGLNLVWDRYRYRYVAGEWGPEEAPLLLEGNERGAVPAELLDRRPRVRSRVGIDRSPIDVTTDEGARLLRCYVWADQRERLERLDRAIEALRAAPPELVRGDVVEELPEVLAGRGGGALTVVFQTAVFLFLSDEGRERIRAALDGAGAMGPLAFVSAGKPRGDIRSWGLRLVIYPGAERTFLGHADYHGAWLDWSPE